MSVCLKLTINFKSPNSDLGLTFIGYGKSLRNTLFLSQYLAWSFHLLKMEIDFFLSTANKPTPPPSPCKASEDSKLTSEVAGSSLLPDCQRHQEVVIERVA